MIYTVTRAVNETNAVSSYKNKKRYRNNHYKKRYKKNNHSNQSFDSLYSKAIEKTVDKNEEFPCVMIEDQWHIAVSKNICACGFHYGLINSNLQATNIIKMPYKDITCPACKNLAKDI